MAVMRRSNQQEVVECRDNLSWSSEDLASVLLSTMKLKDVLQEQQLKGVFVSSLHFNFLIMRKPGYFNDNNIYYLI